MSNNNLAKFKTLTGFSFEDVLKEMKRVLHTGAYKEIEGQPYLTDINPTFLVQTVNKLFGPIGIGWYYEFEKDGVTHSTYQQKTSKGTRTMHAVGIHQFSVYLAYLDENGEQHWSKPIMTVGGSDNSNYGYALKGAITRCLGGVFAQLEWQLYTFRGVVDHKNAEKMKPIIDTWLDGEAEEGEGAEEKEKKDGTSQVEESGNGKVTETVDNKDPLTAACEFVIPNTEQVPLSGTPLGEAIEHPAIGEKLLEFLVGESANRAGDYFEPGDDNELKQLEKFAKVLFNEKVTK